MPHAKIPDMMGIVLSGTNYGVKQARAQTSSLQAMVSATGGSRGKKGSGGVGALRVVAARSDFWS